MRWIIGDKKIALLSQAMRPSYYVLNIRRVVYYYRKVIAITLNPKDKNDKMGKMPCEVDCQHKKAALLSQAKRRSMLFAVC